MEYFAGSVLTEGAFCDGYIGVEDGVVKRVGRGPCPFKAAAKGTIIPTLVNAHSHIGDSALCIEPKPGDSYKELVAPPKGLKHRLLAKTPKKVLIEGMRESLITMARTGTSAFCDFREGGGAGVKMLRDAGRGSPVKPVVFGRPKGLQYSAAEVRALLKNTEGIGVSSISDWDFSELQKLSAHARREKKMFAIHASERIREDIGKVLDLKPSFVVHMLEATDSDLRECAEAGVPVAACPRSNMYFGKVPEIPRILKSGCTLLLGTDNGFACRPDMFAEMEAAYRSARLRGGATSREILLCATQNPRKVFSACADTGIAEGARAGLIVLKGTSAHLLVARGCAMDAALVQIGRWRMEAMK